VCHRISMREACPGRGFQRWLWIGSGGVVRKNKIRLRSLLREALFVMQAAEYGSLYHPVSDRQTVSVRVGRHALRRGLRQIGSQRRMRPPTIIVRGPLTKNSVEMTFVERNHEVETLATKAPPCARRMNRIKRYRSLVQASTAPPPPVRTETSFPRSHRLPSIVSTPVYLDRRSGE
jgi:hypothetical protein